MMDGLTWFSEFGSRECREILKEEFQKGTQSKGVFLVRRGLSNPKYPYILVCFKKDKSFLNYPIRQYGDDAFFSLDSKHIVHGLDELIKYYCKKRNEYESPVKFDLSAYNPILSGTSPPFEACKSGKTSYLHQAVINGKISQVERSLKIDPHNVYKKNEHGQTLLHLVCINDDESYDENIFPMLLNRGAANLFSRDCSGDTAFMCACRNNKKNLVNMMIKMDIEIIQVRNSKTLQNALHFAADFGHHEIVKILLDNSVSVLQQNKDGNYPIDLAVNKGHMEVVKLLTSFQPRIRTDHIEWEHGILGREEAKNLLKNEQEKLQKQNANEKIDGIFLIRFSTTTRTYILSTLENGEFQNFYIRRNKHFYYIEGGSFMHSLDHLVSHYMMFADGLPSKLQHPVRPRKCQIFLEGFQYTTMSQPKIFQRPLPPVPSSNHIYENNRNRPLPSVPESRSRSKTSAGIRKPLNKLDQIDNETYSLALRRPLPQIPDEFLSTFECQEEENSNSDNNSSNDDPNNDGSMIYQTSENQKENYESCDFLSLVSHEPEYDKLVYREILQSQSKTEKVNLQILQEQHDDEYDVDDNESVADLR